jgi:hypothetical protein
MWLVITRNPVHPLTVESLLGVIPFPSANLDGSRSREHLKIFEPLRLSRIEFTPRNSLQPAVDLNTERR